MGPDDPFYVPDGKPTLRQPQPGELLFEFLRDSDHAHFRCVLRVHGEWGVEAQFWMNGELLIAQRFNTRALAVQWAVVERQAIEKGEE